MEQASDDVHCGEYVTYLLGYQDVVNNALHSDGPLAIRVEYESDTYAKPHAPAGA